MENHLNVWFQKQTEYSYEVYVSVFKIGHLFYYDGTRTWSFDYDGRFRPEHENLDMCTKNPPLDKCTTFVENRILNW